MLLASHAPLDQSDKKGVTALLAACFHGQLEVVKQLLSAGASPRHTEDGITPLMAASLSGHAPIVDYLLTLPAGAISEPSTDVQHNAQALANPPWDGQSNGESTSARDVRPHIYTPLMCACGKGHADIVSSLLKKRADTTVAVSGAFMNDGTKPGITALLLACRAGNVSCVRALLQARCSPNEKDDEGTTALMFASRNGHTDTTKALLQSGARVDEAKSTGFNALMFAAKNGHEGALRAILGASPTIDAAVKESRGKDAARTKVGATALMFAAQVRSPVARLTSHVVYGETLSRGMMRAN